MAGSRVQPTQVHSKVFGRLGVKCLGGGACKSKGIQDILEL